MDSLKHFFPPGFGEGSAGGRSSRRLSGCVLLIDEITTFVPYLADGDDDDDDESQRGRRGVRRGVIW